MCGAGRVRSRRRATTADHAPGRRDSTRQSAASWCRNSRAGESGTGGAGRRAGRRQSGRRAGRGVGEAGGARRAGRARRASRARRPGGAPPPRRRRATSAARCRGPRPRASPTAPAGAWSARPGAAAPPRRAARRTRCRDVTLCSMKRARSAWGAGRARTRGPGLSPWSSRTTGSRASGGRVSSLANSSSNDTAHIVGATLGSWLVVVDVPAAPCLARPASRSGRGDADLDDAEALHGAAGAVAPRVVVALGGDRVDDLHALGHDAERRVRVVELAGLEVEEELAAVGARRRRWPWRRGRARRSGRPARRGSRRRTCRSVPPPPVALGSPHCRMPMVDSGPALVTRWHVVSSKNFLSPR